MAEILVQRESALVKDQEPLALPEIIEQAFELWLYIYMQHFSGYNGY